MAERGQMRPGEGCRQVLQKTPISGLKGLSWFFNHNDKKLYSDLRPKGSGHVSGRCCDAREANEQKAKFGRALRNGLSFPCPITSEAEIKFPVSLLANQPVAGAQGYFADPHRAGVHPDHPCGAGQSGCAGRRDSQPWNDGRLAQPALDSPW